jgi:hypothetical protein
MGDLADIQHIFGDDVGVSSTGDLATVTQDQRAQLRIIRRLLTPQTTLTQSAYPWQPEYGAGLGEKVGQKLDVRALQAIVLGQMMLEPSISRTPLPTVTVSAVAQTEQLGGVTIDISYTTMTGILQNFSFNMV